jgi:K+-transporting ATPase ATPase C chain
MILFLTLLTGLVYPGFVTLACQILFPHQAAGNLLHRDGIVIGSALIGQRFTSPAYFHSRPSAAGADGYDASLSSGSNLGPTNRKLIDRVESAKRASRLSGPIPSDLLTASASGLDPHISPASALLQVPRVAAARGIPARILARLVARFTEPRDLGFLGELRVNVLLLNLALDENHPSK